MLLTYPGGEMPYIILFVHCVWTCAKVVLSGFFFLNDEYVDVAFCCIHLNPSSPHFK